MRKLGKGSFETKKEDFVEEKSQDTSGNQSTAEGTL